MLILFGFYIKFFILKHKIHSRLLFIYNMNSEQISYLFIK